MALGSGFFAVACIGRALANHAGIVSLVLGTILAASCVATSRIAIRLPLTFSVDERGVWVRRGRRFVPWSDVEEIRLAHHRSSNEEEHNLVLKLKPSAYPQRRKLITTNATNSDEVEVSLDHISLDWRQVVSDVEAASGMRVHAVREGTFRLRSRPIGRD